VEYDNEAGAFSRTLSLSGVYPSGKMLVVGDKLAVHLRSSTSDATDGGVESVDLTAFSSEGLIVTDATDGIVQTAAHLDPFSNSVYAGIINSSGASQIASYSLVDGSPMAMIPSAEQVAGVGPLNGALWMAGNPFDGSAGALVQISTTDGSEVSRTTQSGRVRAMSVCASGPPAEKEPK
jgi:hypothetical protein